MSPLIEDVIAGGSIRLPESDLEHRRAILAPSPPRKKLMLTMINAHQEVLS